jgi:hypothetical protein
VVGRVLLQVLPYVVPAELREQASDVLLIFELGWVWCWDSHSLDLGVELCNVKEMAATPPALCVSGLLCMRRYLQLTEESSHRSSSVICTDWPGAVSMVYRARGLTCSSSAMTAVAQAAVRRAMAFISTVQPGAGLWNM